MRYRNRYTQKAEARIDQRTKDDLIALAARLQTTETRLIREAIGLLFERHRPTPNQPGRSA